MRRLWAWAVVGFVVAAGGCGVRPEGVVFSHSDEVIRGEGPAEGVWALADRRVFATMAFLNAVGYDAEAAGREMHPIRVKVRGMVAANLAGQGERLEAWRRYYDERRLGPWQYVDFALSLSAEVPFRRIRPASELDYAWTDWMLDGFPEVLNEFWERAGLEEVWAACADEYRRELEACGPEETAGGIAAVWEYLRMPRQDSYTFVRAPNPLERHATASGHRFESYFYSVEGPGSDGYVHEYLHTVLNDLVGRHCGGQRDKLMGYFEAGRDAEISASYQELNIWVSECMVHAVSYRLVAVRSDGATAERVERGVRSLTDGGYRLLGPFYDRLGAYEKSGMAFDRYLPILLAELGEYGAE